MDAPEILTTGSLRRTALIYVTVLLSVIGLAASAFAYLYAYDAATEFLDGQLRQITLNARALSPADAPAQADQDPEDNAQSPSGMRRAGSSTRHSRPSTSPLRSGRAMQTPKPRARTGGLHGGRPPAHDSGRAARMVRQEIAQTAALGAAAPVLIAIPLAWLVVGWAMNRGAGAPERAVIELAKRSVGAIAPIALDGIPAEVAPLARSMNSLIVRLDELSRRRGDSFLTPLTNSGRPSPGCRSRSKTFRGGTRRR